MKYLSIDKAIALYDDIMGLIEQNAIYLAKAFVKLNAPQSLPNNFYARVENIVKCRE